MSVITEVILLVYPTTKDDVAAIEAYEFENLRENSFPQYLRKLNSDAAGGSKWPSWDVFQAAFNYVGDSTIHRFFDQLPDYLSAVIMIQTESRDEPYIKTRNLEFLPEGMRA